MIKQLYKSDKKTDREVNKSEQFLYEIFTWERLLDFCKQENSYLKNRLSQVVDCRTDRDFLMQAEHYQNQFILKDEFIDELQKDVLDQEKRMNEVNNLKIDTDDKNIKRQQKLRNEIEFLEKEFSFVKNEFNKYLSNFL
ncbi:MAG: hypothetical protein ACOYKE_01030, partial [Ferruginibacter sp.]